MPPVRWCSAATERYGAGRPVIAASIAAVSASPKRSSADAGEAVPALEAAEHRRERVAAGHLVRAVGAEQQPRAGLVGDPLEQRRALGVGPVQVLEHEHRRPVADQAVHDLQRGVQPLDRAAARVGQGGERGLVDVGVPLDRVEQHLVRAGERSGLGAADQRDDVVGQRVEQLAHQAGLADARLAGDDRDLGLLGRDEPLELAQLAGPADHRLAGAAARGSHAVTLPPTYDEAVLPSTD